MTVTDHHRSCLNGAIEELLCLADKAYDRLGLMTGALSVLLPLRQILHHYSKLSSRYAIRFI